VNDSLIKCLESRRLNLSPGELSDENKKKQGDSESKLKWRISWSSKKFYFLKNGHHPNIMMELFFD